MNKRERAPFHEAANTIAKQAWIDIRVLEGKAIDMKKQPMLIPRSTPGPLRDLPAPGRGRALRAIRERLSDARRDIDGVLRRLPPHADLKDWAAIETQARAILHGRPLKQAPAPRLERGDLSKLVNAEAENRHEPAPRIQAQDMRPPKIAPEPIQAEPVKPEPMKTAPPAFADGLLGSKFYKPKEHAPAPARTAEQGRSPKPGLQTAFAETAQDVKTAQQPSDSVKTRQGGIRESLNYSRFLSDKDNEKLQKARQKGRGRDLEP